LAAIRFRLLRFAVRPHLLLDPGDDGGGVLPPRGEGLQHVFPRHLEVPLGPVAVQVEHGDVELGVGEAAVGSPLAVGEGLLGVLGHPGALVAEVGHGVLRRHHPLAHGVHVEGGGLAEVALAADPVLVHRAEVVDGALVAGLDRPAGPVHPPLGGVLHLLLGAVHEPELAHGVGVAVLRPAAEPVESLLAVLGAPDAEVEHVADAELALRVAGLRPLHEEFESLREVPLLEGLLAFVQEVFRVCHALLMDGLVDNTFPRNRGKFVLTSSSEPGLPVLVLEEAVPVLPLPVLVGVALVERLHLDHPYSVMDQAS
jgi:hypothetical protein